jgi:hypothetical protein
MDKGKPP